MQFRLGKEIKCFILRSLLGGKYQVGFRIDSRRQSQFFVLGKVPALEKLVIRSERICHLMYSIFSENGEMAPPPFFFKKQNYI